MTVLTYGKDAKPAPRQKGRIVTQAEQLQALDTLEKEWLRATRGQPRPTVNLRMMFAEFRDIIKGVQYE